MEKAMKTLKYHIMMLKIYYVLGKIPPLHDWANEKFWQHVTEALGFIREYLPELMQNPLFVQLDNMLRY